MEIINQMPAALAVITEKGADSVHCIKLQNQYYKTMDAQGLQVHYHRGTKGSAIKTFDDRLLFSTHDKIYELDVVPEHERKSRNFVPNYIKEKPKKRNISFPKHPWKSETFLKFRCHKVTNEMLAL